MTPEQRRAYARMRYAKNRAPGRVEWHFDGAKPTRWDALSVSTQEALRHIEFALVLFALFILITAYL